MNAISETFRILWLIFLWFGFSFIALASLAMTVIGVWPWGALFFVLSPLNLAYIDMINAENIGYKATGGLFHRFFIFVYSINAVGLIVLTVLTAFGVLQGDPAPWTPETNFASWYMVGGLIIVAFLIQRIEPNDDIPDLQCMEQMNRRSTRVGVVSAAIFTVLCLVVPLTSFMTTGYDPAALAVALFLAPGFLRVVREGLFYLQGTRFEEGTEGVSHPACRVRRRGWPGGVYCARVPGLFAGSSGVAACTVLRGVGGDEWVVGEKVRHRGYFYSRRGRSGFLFSC